MYAYPQIIVNTYIKIGDDFINIFDFNGHIDKRDYIEGSIELLIYGKKLIDRSVWDYIVDLWCYLSEGLSVVYDGEEFKTTYPDQPIEVKFKPIQSNHNLLVSVKIGSEEKKIIVDKKAFLSAMLDHAKQFFERLDIIAPKVIHDCTYHINLLKKIDLNRRD